jgi:hypothetical protein
MDLPTDDYLTRAVTELGEPELLFRISRTRFLAKLFLGVLLLVYGVVANYYWWVHGPATFGHLELLLLIVLPLSGGVLLFHMYRERGLYVLVYPTGLLRLRRGEVDSFPWHSIDRILIKTQGSPTTRLEHAADGSLLACWLPVDVPTFQIWNAGLTVVRKDGVIARFGPVLSDYDQFAEEIQRRTFTAFWPATLQQFREGERLPFGDLEVSSLGIQHVGKFLPWRFVKEVTISQGKLSIKVVGKWLPWVLLDLQTLPNPHVLLALLSEGRKLTPAVLPSSQPNPNDDE